MGRSINILVGTVLAIGTLMLFGGPVNAIENPEEDYTLGPGEDGGLPIPMAYDGSYDLKISSDRPVTVYIMSQTQWVSTSLTGNFTTYEAKYDDVTSKTVRYDYGENPSELYYLIIHNPDSEQTAQVHVEIELLEEIGEDIADGAKDSLCGSTILIGICVLGGLISILYLLKRE
ncbi:MAG: hypothetical protein MUC62_04575 [Candidatus Thermoplasmatota archaeon]|nr:hypothetical protein [Candidatus Thermoplasmatota archaeon]